MNNYQGNTDGKDEPKGGGKWVEDNKIAGEVCNFLKCSDGYYYGYVETLQKDEDRKIRIEELGISTNAESVSGITVIWTATDPEARGRYVVGWYRDAQVFRQRQPFPSPPSRQHRAEKLESFHIRARNATLLPKDRRVVALKSRTKGWMGHTQWWFPERRAKEYPEIQEFLREIDALLNNDEIQVNVDIAEIESSPNLTATEKKALVAARIGQGEFRRSLEREWSGCSVTGCGLRQMLRASHIKPWAVSDDKERLDRNNGLLLLANLDAAFEYGLITFSDSGRILVSSKLTQQTCRLLGLTEGMALRTKPTPARKAYLEYHRREKFRD